MIMRHIKRVNELFGIMTKLRNVNEDEETARGILDKLINSEVSVKKSKSGNKETFEFKVDGFNITSIYKAYPFFEESMYYLYIDDVLLQTSKYIAKRVWFKCDDINTQLENDIEKYTKKDAKTHFSKK